MENQNLNATVMQLTLTLWLEFSGFLLLLLLLKFMALNHLYPLHVSVSFFFGRKYIHNLAFGKSVVKQEAKELLCLPLHGFTVSNLTVCGRFP